MRHPLFSASGATFLGLATAALAAAGEPPLQPSLDAAGNYIHRPDTTVIVTAISAGGLTVECREAGGAGSAETIWRERYNVKDGKLVLAAVSTERQVAAQPAHTEWQETTVAEVAAPVGDKEPLSLPGGTPVGGADLRGAMVDPRWSGFPAYLRTLTQAIETVWNRERIQRKLLPHSGSRVAVRFVLNSRGEVSKVDSVELTPGTPDAAVRACVAAVTGPSPFPRWTDAMVAVLGSEQTLMLAFYYP